MRLNQPRFATVPNIMKVKFIYLHEAKKKIIEELSLESLGIKMNQSLKVLKTEAPLVR